MGQSGEQFLQVRAMEVMYASDFTKKQATNTGVELVNNMIEGGEVDKLKFAGNLARLNEVVSAAMTEIRKHLPESKTEVFGVTFTPKDGGNTINYSEDPVYAQLQKDLKDREALLKLAQKQEVLDLGGIEVPKVSTTPRKSSVMIEF